MAFENTYGNIDFQSGNKMKMAQQDQFARSLAQGMQQYNIQQDREMKMSQLEAQKQAAQAKAASNYKQVAMDELNRISQGGAPTEQGQAAIKVMQQTTADKVYTDPMGNVVKQPNPWTGAGQAPQQIPIFQGRSPSAIPLDRALNVPQVTEQELYGDIQAPQGRVAPPTPADSPFADVTAVEPTIGSDEGRKRFEAGKKYGALGEKKELDVSADVFKSELKRSMQIEDDIRKAKRPSFQAKEGFTPSADDVKSMTKIMTSKKMLTGLIEDYKGSVKTHGVSVEGTKGAKEIGRVAGKIRMQVKNLEELGALQEPDIKAMDEMLGSAILSGGDVLNPISGYTQIKEGDAIALDSMNEFGSYINNIVDAQAESRGFDIMGKKTKPQGAKPQAKSYKDYF